MTVTVSQEIINELSGFEFEVVRQSTRNVVIKTNKGNHVSISLDTHGDYTLYRCTPDSFGGFDYMYSSMKVYRTIKSINKWIIKKHVDTSKELEVSAVPNIEESNESETENEVKAEAQAETMQVDHKNGQIVITSQSGDRLAVSTDDVGKLNVRFLSADEGEKVAKVEHIAIEWTEAPIDQDAFKSAKELDSAMEKILNSPDCNLPNGCYYKTKVTVYFDDGESWQDRIDYTKSGRLSDSRLVKDFEYYQKRYVAGSEKPEWMSQEELESRIKFYGSRSII